MKARFLVIVAVVILICASSFAQETGAEELMRSMQQEMRESNIETQNAIDNFNTPNNTTSNVPTVGITAAPSFSVKAGKVAAGTTVRIASKTHYAVIYYTTNGWSPNTSSRKYKGPITINATTQLQAIAVAPNLRGSMISSVKYSVSGAQSPAQPLVLPDGVLHAGTRLHIATGTAMSSKTAQVGDPISLLLDQDVKVGDAVVAPNGTPVSATITVADHSAMGGQPGDIAFEIHSITVHGKEIPLKGGESLQGPGHQGRVLSVFFIPVVGLGGLAIHGGEAEIHPGMTMTAAVVADTPLL